MQDGWDGCARVPVRAASQPSPAELSSPGRANSLVQQHDLAVPASHAKDNTVTPSTQLAAACLLRLMASGCSFSSQCSSGLPSSFTYHSAAEQRKGGERRGRGEPAWPATWRGGSWPLEAGHRVVDKSLHGAAWSYRLNTQNGGQHWACGRHCLQSCGRKPRLTHARSLSCSCRAVSARTTLSEGRLFEAFQ